MFSVSQFGKSTNPTMNGEAIPYTPGAGFAAGTQNNIAEASGAPGFEPQAAQYKPQTQASALNLIQTNGNPLGGVYSQPGAFGNPVSSATPSPASNPFANPSFQSGIGGYNPSQYATTDTANNLARQLGGSVMQTRNAPNSPVGPPPQNMIDFGGADMLNAGLLAERYAKYDRATADAMTRAELAQMGRRSDPNEDSEGGTLGSWSQYQPVSGGQSFLGQGSNLGSAVGSAIRTPQVGGTSPGFNPFEAAPPQFNPRINFGGGPNFNPELRQGGGPLMQSPEGWASRYSRYRIPYGNRRYYPGMGAAPRFQPRQDYFQPRPPLAWY